jgi:hypothetical protein
MNWLFNRTTQPAQPVGDPSYESIVEMHPEIRKLLITLTMRIDTPETNDLVANTILELWPQRRISEVTKQQVTQDEVIKEMSNKCFEFQVKQIKNLIRQASAQYKSGAIDVEFYKTQVKQLLYSVIFGFASHHEKEINMNPDGTIQSLKSVRAVMTFGNKDCKLRIRRSDYDKLPEESKQTVKQHYIEEGIPDFIIENAGGKRRKTHKKKRRSKKKTSKKSYY